jgi:hypothetical protein
MAWQFKMAADSVGACFIARGRGQQLKSSNSNQVQAFYVPSSSIICHSIMVLRCDTVVTALNTGASTWHWLNAGLWLHAVSLQCWPPEAAYG